MPRLLATTPSSLCDATTPWAPLLSSQPLSTVPSPDARLPPSDSPDVRFMRPRCVEIVDEPVSGVLRISGSPPPWRQEMMIATLVRPGLHAGFRAAAHLHDLDGFRRPPSIEVVVGRRVEPSAELTSFSTGSSHSRRRILLSLTVSHAPAWLDRSWTSAAWATPTLPCVSSTTSSGGEPASTGYVSRPNDCIDRVSRERGVPQASRPPPARRTGPGLVV